LGLHLAIFIIATAVSAQRTAVLTPEGNSQGALFISELKTSLAKKLIVLDDEMSSAAFQSVNPQVPFNMTTEMAMRVGEVIGCQYFILVRTGKSRRVSLEKPPYIEAHAAVFVVSSRSGRLVFWRMQSFEAPESKQAETLLAASAAMLSTEIAERLKTIGSAELLERPIANIEEVPLSELPEAKNFRPPMPYKRIKPEYSSTAYLYSVAATVDALLDVDENGNILRIDIARWAGYGLDEAVTEAIRKMNWRPGEKNGKTLPVRVLLRYNFKKIDKEPER
jgi:hypothetical protein